MAIDTAAKRASALDQEDVLSFGTPFPDGTIGQGDRQHLIWSYSGIAVGQLVVGGPAMFASMATYSPGFQEMATFVPGFQEMEVYNPGFQEASSQ